MRREEEDIAAVATVTATVVTALAMAMPAESEASARDATEAMAEVTGSSESLGNQRRQRPPPSKTACMGGNDTQTLSTGERLY